MTAAAKTDVIVFLTHVFDAEIERRFFKLKRDCSGLCDVVVLAEQGTRIPPSVAPFAHMFDFASLTPLASSVIGETLIPGNCHLRSIDFHRRFPHYRHYWFVEYDVVYTGNWGRLISSLTDDPSDLLASHVRTLADEPDWYWGKSFSTGTDAIAQDEWILAFMPIHRLSSRACEAVAKKVSEGWVGHFEVLLPTALAHCGLRVSDIGGSGAWTPKERRLRHYVDWYAGPYLYGTGTLRYRPNIRSRLIRNKLYHPCKTPSSAFGDMASTQRLVIARARLKNRRTFVLYWLRLFRSALVSLWRR